MSTVVVRYKVKEGRGDENQRLVEAVFAELNATDPGGVRYRTFRLEDGVTFVHVAETDGESNPLGGLASFQEFQRELLDRCDEPPAPMAAEMIGSYRLPD